MPNWCANRLSIPPRPGVLMADVQMIITSLRGPNGALDFESVLPIPAALRDIHQGGQHINGAYYSRWREEVLPDGSIHRTAIPAEELTRLRAEHDFDCPMNWCIRHWGSKWNAETYERDWDGSSILFDTAWNPPMGFVRALSRKYRDIQFELRFVEPGMNMNGRVICYRGEDWQTENYEMESDAGRENAELVGLCLSETAEIGV